VTQLREWKHDTYISDDAVKRLLADTAGYEALINMLNIIQDNLDHLNVNETPEEDAIRDAIAKFMNHHTEFMRQPSEPVITETLTASVKTCFDATKTLWETSSRAAPGHSL
jgi:hypothetical protein